MNRYADELKSLWSNILTVLKSVLFKIDRLNRFLGVFDLIRPKFILERFRGWVKPYRALRNVGRSYFENIILINWVINHAAIKQVKGSNFFIILLVLISTDISFF